VLSWQLKRQKDENGQLGRDCTVLSSTLHKAREEADNKLAHADAKVEERDAQLQKEKDNVSRLDRSCAELNNDLNEAAKDAGAQVGRCWFSLQSESRS
jgi:chromosome segregation ATPase